MTDKIRVTVEINPVEVDGVQYCRYKGKCCEWFYIYSMCRYDDYSCELFDQQGSNKDRDFDLRPKICLENTVE